MLSQTLRQTLVNAVTLAQNKRHEYVGLEHLLYVLLEDPDAGPILQALPLTRILSKLNSRPYWLS